LLGGLGGDGGQALDWLTLPALVRSVEHRQQSGGAEFGRLLHHEVGRGRA
jgi:hypothetical protein